MRWMILVRGQIQDNVQGVKPRVLPLIACLRQVVTPTGEAVRVKVPFSTSDLNSCPEEVRNYKEDPSKVVKMFELCGWE